jgi:hypothetical protein
VGQRQHPQGELAGLPWTEFVRRLTRFGNGPSDVGRIKFLDPAIALLNRFKHNFGTPPGQGIGMRRPLNIKSVISRTVPTT